MLRRFCCATAVPSVPGDAPITADGLDAKEFAFHGRLAQSIAFLRLPGMLRLYSGVTNNTASTAAIAALNAWAAGGKSASKSRLYTGKSAMGISTNRNFSGANRTNA